MTEWNPEFENRAAGGRAPDVIGSTLQLEQLLRVIPRPFVLVNERELSVLRRGLTKNGWKRGLYLQPEPKRHGPYVGAGLLSLANRWLETEVVIPEYGAGSFLQHEELAGAALALGLAFSIEKDRNYSAKAVEILLGYARSYAGGSDDASWTIPLAQAYDLIYYSRSLGDRERTAIESGLLRPVAEGLQFTRIDADSTAWRLSTVGVIGLAMKDPSLVLRALDAFRHLIGTQIGEDGLWPGFFQGCDLCPLAGLVHFAEACHRAGIDLFNWEPRPGRSLKSIFTALVLYMYPSFQLPMVADRLYGHYLPLDLFEVAYRRWSEPSFAWVLKKGYKFGEVPLNVDQRENRDTFSRMGFHAFLFGRDLPGSPAAPVFAGRDYPALGACTLRNDQNTMVTFSYGGPESVSGGCALGFTLYANKALLIPGRGPMRDSAPDSKRAPNNTVMVDCMPLDSCQGSGLADRVQCRGTVIPNVCEESAFERHEKQISRKLEMTNSRKTELPRLAARVCGERSCFVEAAAQDCYPGVTHTRSIVMIDKICIVRDRLVSGDAHDYDWLVRLDGEPKVIGEPVPVRVPITPCPHVRLEQAYCADESFCADWEHENGNLALGLWGDGEDAVAALGTCLEGEAARETSVLVCRKHGREAGFLAAFLPHAAGEEAGLTREGALVKVATESSVYHICLRGAGSPCPDIESDAEVAVVTTVGEDVAAIMVIGGSWLRWKGDLWLECPNVVDSAEVSFEGRRLSVTYRGDTAGPVKVKARTRSVRVNGHRTGATANNGHTLLRVMSHMLVSSS